jgi:hypothetical protein
MMAHDHDGPGTVNECFKLLFLRAVSNRGIQFPEIFQDPPVKPDRGARI